MVLTEKEKAIALISNGIAAFSIYQEQNSLPEGITPFDFILKTIPDELKKEVTVDLIDEIFEYVSNAHNS